MKILAVCLGNICRSPLAEGLLRREIDNRGLDWEVASGGTANYHIGKPPDPRSIAIAQMHGLDISTQRSHHVTAADIAAYDLILAMDRQNAMDLRARAQTVADRDKIQVFLEYGGVSEKYGPDVYDPYYDDEAYSGVYEVVEKAVKGVVDRLTVGD